MNKSVKVLRLFGIDIELHYTWFLIFALLAWALSANFFPFYYQGLTQIQYWGIGIASSLLLFGSVLIHEMSHSLIARHHNIKVDKITLFFFGGIAHIDGKEELTPWKEFNIASAGPIISFALAGMFFLIFKNITYVYLNSVSFYLYKLNLILALFNLAPGFPLDGGRIFRAVIWGITGDIKKATRVAAFGGKVVAVTLMMFGFFGIIAGLGTWWFIIIGIFLYMIAGASYDQVLIKEALSRITIKKLITKKVKTVKPSLKLSNFVNNYLLKDDVDEFFVVDKGKLLGVATIQDVKKIPKEEWKSVQVKNIVSKIPSVKENANAMNVLMKMSDLKLTVIPVLKGKKLIGIISARSLMRYIKIQSD